LATGDPRLDMKSINSSLKAFCSKLINKMGVDMRKSAITFIFEDGIPLKHTKINYKIGFD
jgi:hypothetical protein